jgi:hypothetical protein
MKAQNPHQTISRATGPLATIRFSGADGKVLTWMKSSESVHTDLRHPRSRLVLRATFVTILVVLATFWVAATVVVALRDR